MKKLHETSGIFGFGYFGCVVGCKFNASTGALLSPPSCSEGAVVRSLGIRLGISVTTPYTPASGGHQFPLTRKPDKRFGYTVANLGGVTSAAMWGWLYFARSARRDETKKATP
jgi:hypothetical protein